MMIKGLQALKTPALQVLNSAVKAKKCAIEAFHPKVQAEMKETYPALTLVFAPKALSTVPEEALETPSAEDKKDVSGPPR